MVADALRQQCLPSRFLKGPLCRVPELSTQDRLGSKSCAGTSLSAQNTDVDAETSKLVCIGIQKGECQRRGELLTTTHRGLVKEVERETSKAVFGERYSEGQVILWEDARARTVHRS
jgi:hypothetical protein